jgi:hypothetical protein
VQQSELAALWDALELCRAYLLEIINKGYGELKIVIFDIFDKMRRRLERLWYGV